MSKPDKFQTASNTRQAILDYANQHGRCTCVEVAAYLKISCDHANRSMRKMVSDGEMERWGSQKSVVYLPLATNATTADEMRNRMVVKRKAARIVEVEKANARAKRTGRCVNVCSDSHPTRYPNQGGQGAIRSSVTIQAIQL